VAEHDLGQLRAIRRPARRSHDRFDFVKVLRTDRRGRHDDAVTEVERDWKRELGSKRLELLRELLVELPESM